MRDRLVVGKIAHEAQQFADRLARRVAGHDDIGDGDRAGIDEGIARNAVLVLELDDGVEGRAGRLAADTLPEPLAHLAERQRQHEDLGNALDGERHIGIADRDRPCRRR